MTMTNEDFKKFESLPPPDDLKDTAPYYQFKLGRYRNKCFVEAVKKDLGIENHPKADNLISIAWDIGHSSGFHEVYIWAQVLVELIR